MERYDDIVLCCTSREEVERKVDYWRGALEDRGLKISRKKTEYLSFMDESDGDVKMQSNILKRVETLKYLGSTMANNGELDAEITHRV